MLGKFLMLCSLNIAAMLVLVSMGEEAKKIVKEEEMKEEEKMLEIFRKALKEE